MKHITLAVLTFFALVFAASASPITALYVTGSPTSWVTQGVSQNLNPAGAGIGACFLGDAPDSCIISSSLRDPQYWYLEFAAPFGENLSVGMYDGVTRYYLQSASNPTMFFDEESRGDNTLTGYFNILELSLTDTGMVNSLAVDFVQYDEGVTDNWNFGSLRINSNIGINTSPTPEPASLLLLGGGMVVLVFYRRTRRGY